MKPTTPNSIEVGSPVKNFYDPTWFHGCYEQVASQPFPNDTREPFSNKIFQKENNSETIKSTYYYPSPSIESSENIGIPTQYFFPPNFETNHQILYNQNAMVTPTSADSFGSISPENFTGGVQGRGQKSA